ncbi:DUF7619 domain-containing protein [Psychroserpens algicola]|uniref:T9SS type A sorting domain-containing protein n=1 Tax=Psychroserpens algicola TaxID=1719034 RepID=A0ABT0H782_9FLAO|nr:T9SS type A sorting domain-containing protein [Psychroserpens algicola]MCK8479692.1 T9SS type A sorting domain-containing protein [Psychroserpens algicola]
MKHFYFISFLLLTALAQSQIITFPDAELKNKLLASSTESYIAVDSAGNAVAIDTNSDNEIDITEASVIYELDISSSNISDLTGLEHFVNLIQLEVNLNNISTFDGTAFTNLEYLNFSNNSLTSTNLTGLSNLQIFWAFGNPFTSIDVSDLSSLSLLDISYCDNLTSLDVSNLTNLTDLSCTSNDSMTNLNLNGCTALEDLGCAYSALTSLDLSGLTSLSTMFAEQNNITSIDVTGAVSLGNLNIAFNQVTSLVVHDLPVLQSISASGNMISNLDIQNCPLFFTLVMGDNQLTSLDLSNVPSTTIVQVENNLLETINLAENNDIVQIRLSNNLLTEINLNNCSSLNWGSFDNNPNLESILMKNGSTESLFNININNLPNLQYVCADTEHLNDVQIWLNNNGYGNVNINSYCSFTPGGEFFEIHGLSQYDFESNGCSTTDTTVPFMSYSIDDGIIEAIGVADSTGVYRIPVQQGSYTITPTQIDPTLYDVFPNSFTVEFPQDGSTFEQNFCIVPNSTVNDLEVILTPLTPARPGFDANYRLMIKNVGNQILSGDVSLTYPENLTTFLESDVMFDNSTSDSYTWNITNLIPFQSFTVELVFNVNPPTDPDFPVNIDDILSFVATVNPIENDITPENNTHTLDQTVVGSFDPNDILCLEGDSILLENVGEFVHYRIRFENTGTFPAQNIVVKNNIDTQKFDLSSLTVLDGSHEFVTRIIDNEIEFILEDINLPFDDANNDGFILYKIRTLASLMEGDMFSNSAEIYFDFNFPIETNNYNTTIVTDNLSVHESEVTDLTIYPNPVDDLLIFNTDIDIDNIQILDVLGKLIKEVTPNYNTNKVNVSNLTNGMYFIVFESDNKRIIRKFLK